MQLLYKQQSIHVQRQLDSHPCLTDHGQRDPKLLSILMSEPQAGRTQQQARLAQYTATPAMIIRSASTGFHNAESKPFANCRQVRHCCGYTLLPQSERAELSGISGHVTWAQSPSQQQAVKAPCLSFQAHSGHRRQCPRGAKRCYQCASWTAEGRTMGVRGVSSEVACMRALSMATRGTRSSMPALQTPTAWNCWYSWARAGRRLSSCNHSWKCTMLHGPWECPLGST